MPVNANSTMLNVSTTLQLSRHEGLIEASSLFSSTNNTSLGAQECMVFPDAAHTTTDRQGAIPET